VDGYCSTVEGLLDETYIDGKRDLHRWQKRPTSMAKETYIDGSASHLNGYCSTVEGLLDWFEVDLGFTELSFVCVCAHTHT